MSRENLQGRSKQELADLAKKKRIAGWQDMRKDQLIEALARNVAGKSVAGKSRKKKVAAKAPPTPAVQSAQAAPSPS